MIKIVFILLAIGLLNNSFAQEPLPANNLSLREAISFALKNNPVMKMAESEVNASAGRYLGGFWLESPKVSLTYEEIPTGSPVKNFGERYVEVSQSFDDPFGIYYKAKGLSAQKAITEADYKNSELQVLINVKRAYYLTLALSEQLKIQEKHTALLQDFLQKSEQRLIAGEGTNLEFLTAKVEFNEARNFSGQLNNNYKNALNDLALALGVDNSSHLEDVHLTDSLNRSSGNLNVDELLSAADRNPVLRSAALNVSRTSYDKKYAWTKLLPSFDLAYFRETIGSNPNFYGVSLGVSVPLWFIFNERGSIQEASANQKSAEFELKSKQLEISTGIKNAFNNYINEKNQLNTYKNEILPLAEEVYRTAKASYDAGEISYIEFLQAQRTLITAQNNFITVMLNHNLALIAIEEAAGIQFNGESK